MMPWRFLCKLVVPVMVATVLPVASASLSLEYAGRHSPPLLGARTGAQRVVVVVEENRSFGQIIGNPKAPYINLLASSGALFTNSHGVTHPSLPNYFALFAGRLNTNGDGCPATGISRNASNLASELLAANRGLSFAGYAESMPEAGFQGCSAGTYARKHAPWVHFSNVPRSASLPLSTLRSFGSLPSVAFIIPNIDDDMHDGTIAQGDAWLEKHIAPMLAWGRTHDLLLIVTWDEGFDPDNHIPTIFFGSMVRPGRYSERITHYNVFRTIDWNFIPPRTGAAANVQPITDCWRPLTPRP
ncbi:MAG: acid phosphatase [Candidatus Eremiobacteraeota bacterium]|nr:acid phosphatase [Candidatus Eremiobacteraeota bacterium]